MPKVAGRLCIWGMVALASAAPGHAQLHPETKTGSLMAARPNGIDPKAAGVIRKHFAQCVYHTSRRKVLTMLAHSDVLSVGWGSGRIANSRVDLQMEGCLGQQANANEDMLGLRLNAETLRDLMAEEAYLDERSTAPQVAPDAPPLAPALVSTGPELATAQALTSFTDCAVRHDPAAADALLRTMPGSANETAAAAALAPVLGGCLVEGQRVALKPASIRALIAFAMWSRFGRK